MSQYFPITLTQIAYFQECARLLNMTQASYNLHVAQSAISTAISQLEKQLGVTLFIRQRAKGLQLTPAGVKFLHDSQELFGMLNASIESLRDEQRSVEGKVTLAFFKTLGPFLLPQLITWLSDRYPNLAVEYVEGDYEETVSALLHGKADLAVTYSLDDTEGLQFEMVTSAPAYVILPSSHPFAAKRAVSLAELADLPLVLLDLPDSRDYFLGMLKRAGVAPEPRYRTSSYETVRAMVAAGLGYSILNQRPASPKTYSGEKVAALELVDDVPALNVAIAHLAQVIPTARTRAVAEGLRSILRANV